MHDKTEGASPVLTVENLRVRVSGTQPQAIPVDGVSFQLRAGEVFGLVGESGSGKSLTALSLMGLHSRPLVVDKASSIVLGEMNLSLLPERTMRQVRGKDIAMVFQEPMTSLNPVHRIGKQIDETLRLHNFGDTKARKRRVIEMLDLVGIPSPEKRYFDFPHQLSGGMRQRVMIAMALACSPKVLVADEPTTALDVTIQAQILDLIRSLSLELDMATLLITHDMAVVAENCDEVAVMYAGKIIEQGPTGEVLHDPRHPYTRALIDSIPKPGLTKQVRLASIPGVVPRSDEWPVGCRFANRCSFRRDECEIEYPPTVSVGNHSVACILEGEGHAA